MKTAVIALVVFLLVIAVGLYFFSKKSNQSLVPANQVMQPTPVSTSTTVVPSTMTEQTSAPVMQIDKKKQYQAVLSTSVGDITISLQADSTPITVNNFVVLAKKGFYNNTVFHRVIKGFMIQGGDPKGDGTGGPGYRFPDESFSGDYTRGTIAMANAGPNTNGSQFFIMHQDYTLPKNYVIFGKVTAGLDVVDAIATAPVSINPGSGENSKPVASVVVRRVVVTEK